ncbi:Synaptic vesicle 2 protein [Fasciola hepatica]|uniref:Synaptic vesicle 2 protein n=1 Tax=Fasciola hepatica TaxID=6192 RepID=A0A4E0R597_FASHE|nr:Synaptic vesicle 2 protein [Fasciola hepatica]
MDPPRPSSVQVVLDQLGFGWYQIRVIIIMGIVQSTDTMETLIQAILGPTLRCEWNLDSDLVALLATMVFLGVCIGSPPMGYASDHLGRKALSLLCCLALTYMTLLCAITPTYLWLAILRFISGLYISGLLTAGGSMISEFLPETYQATGQLLVCSFDSFVGLYIVGVGFGCLVGHLSWRYFLLFSTFPLIISALGMYLLLHESPMILSHWGSQNEAAKVLDAIARSNNRVPKSESPEIEETGPFSFVGRLPDESERQEVSVSGFFKILGPFIKEYPLPTLLLVGISFIWGMIIYGGTTLLPVELPSTPRTCLQSLYRGTIEQPSIKGQTPGGNEDCCLPLLKEGYMSLLSSVVGSVLSFPIALGLITVFGRRWTINTCFFLTAVLLFIEAFCMPPKALRVVFFATRAVAAAGNNATTIYLTGLYAPHVRSFAFGVMSTFYRIGVLTAPFLGQVFLQRISALGAVLIFSSLAVLGFVLSVLLPHAEDPIQQQQQNQIKSGRRIFRNIFKKRPPMTTSAASAAASGMPEFRVATIDADEEREYRQQRGTLGAQTDVNSDHKTSNTHKRVSFAVPVDTQ